MIQESQACIDAYTSGQKEKTEREDFEGGCGEDGEGKQPLNRDEGEERVVASELGCNVSQVGERAESSHLGDIEGEMGCSERERWYWWEENIWEVEVVRGLERRGGDEDRDDYVVERKKRKMMMVG